MPKLYASDTAPPQGNLRRAFAFVRPYRGTIGSILTLTLMIGVLSAIEPLVLKSIFDALGGKADLVVAAVVMLLVLGIGRELLSAVSNWLTWKTRLRVHYSLLEATVS